MCTPQDLEIVIARSYRPLVVLDCEGAEVALLDPATVPSLHLSDILVETHDCLGPGSSDILEQRLGASHEVERIIHGARNPNGLSQLETWTEIDLWLLVNEGRPQGMIWLFCRSKAGRSPTVAFDQLKSLTCCGEAGEAHLYAGTETDVRTGVL